MEISDFFGFFFSILVMLFVFGRYLLRRHKNPEDEKQQKKTLKDFLKSLDVDMEGLDEEEEAERAMPRVPVMKQPPPPPPQIKAKPHRKVEDDFRFQTRVEQRRFETKVEQRRLETAVEKRKQDFGANIVSSDLRHGQDAYARALAHTEKSSRGLELVSRLGSKKNMIILQEILNPPKAFGPAGYRDRY